MTKNLQLYVHIPFCMRKCDYCDFLSFTANNRTQTEYVDALLKEIKYYGERLGKTGEYYVSTIFFGGGTPSWIETEELLRILGQIRESFIVDEDAEISVECNPGTATGAKLGAYFKAGVNRLSIGCQSVLADELKLLGRVHTYEQFLKTYDLSRSVGFNNINVDLISALPYQDRDKFMISLQEIHRLRPEHISVYTLIVEPGTPFYDRYKFDDVKQQAGMQTEMLPTEDEAYAISKVTQLFLKEQGYHRYEISNFAKPGFECRHNIGYWSRENYLGFGLGAASLIENIRLSNVRDLYEYLSRTERISEHPECALATNVNESIQILSRKEQMEEFMFLGLRKTDGVSRIEFEQIFDVPVESIYHNVIEKLKKQQLLESREGRIYLTDKGLDLSNYAMAQFLS